MEYKKVMDMKIVRIKHEITLYLKGSAGSLKKALKDIPDSAILIDEEEAEGGQTKLIFLEEQVV